MNSQSSFTVISTFSGCGGSSLGYQLAGGKVLLAVEWDDNAVATYRLNFPDTPIYHGDIAKLSVNACCEKAGVQLGELDILDGSPPCQGFSTAGKRDFGDDRNQLFHEYIRLLRGVRPKVFVMENVSGMVKGKMKLIFAECLRELKASGYKVKARLLNAMYFNVPQSRQRLIFVGVREDVGAEPGHPKPSGKVTIRQALEGVVPLTFTGDVVENNKVYRSARRRNKWGGQVCALSCRMNRHGLHPSEKRYFSIEEIAALGSYPLTFRWTGTPDMKTKRIGNSVPPNFMRAIAEHIRDTILAPQLAEAKL